MKRTPPGSTRTYPPFPYPTLFRALLQNLRSSLSGEAASAVHLGATSQDIIDTALVLQLKHACRILDDRLTALVDALSALADAHRDTVTLPRTRWQPAPPTTFGLKVDGGRAPFIRHRGRLAQLRPRPHTVPPARGEADKAAPNARRIYARGELS